MISVDVKRNQSAIFLLLRIQNCFSLAEGLRLTDQLPFEMAKANEPEMIPIRATIISAIFVIPYVVILRVFQGKTNNISFHQSKTNNTSFQQFRLYCILDLFDQAHLT